MIATAGSPLSATLSYEDEDEDEDEEDCEDWLGQVSYQAIHPEADVGIFRS